jgi:hypothetical protein
VGDIEAGVKAEVVFRGAVAHFARNTVIDLLQVGREVREAGALHGRMANRALLALGRAVADRLGHFRFGRIGLGRVYLESLGLAVRRGWIVQINPALLRWLGFARGGIHVGAFALQQRKLGGVLRGDFRFRDVEGARLSRGESFFGRFERPGLGSIDEPEGLGHAHAARGNERAIGAAVGVLFPPGDHLVVALAAAVTAGRGAALPTKKAVGGKRWRNQQKEGEQGAHGRD